MNPTAISCGETLFQRAHTRALREGVTVPEAVRDLLTRWVAGEIDLATEGHARQKLVHLAREAQGMWADRGAGAYLTASRAAHDERDEKSLSVEFYD